MQAIPDDVLSELKQCDVILKGPTTTPQAGDGLPNIESANVAMRKALDLFANVRPVRIPDEGIDWTFFRENTEDIYAGIEFKAANPSSHWMERLPPYAFETAESTTCRVARQMSGPMPSPSMNGRTGWSPETRPWGVMVIMSDILLDGNWIGPEDKDGRARAFAGTNPEYNLYPHHAPMPAKGAACPTRHPKTEKSRLPCEIPLRFL